MEPDPGSKFTLAENAKLIRISIEEENKRGLGTVFKEKMESKRAAAALWSHFKQILLPRLHKMTFHPETKLRLCQVYKVPVDNEFLEELQKDARVQLDNRSFVINYQMKPHCRYNDDMELDDEEFSKLISPSVSQPKQFSSEEDNKMFRYVLEHQETFTGGQTKFWDVLSRRFNRSSRTLRLRFRKCLAPNIHTIEFPVEDKLKLYQICKVAVNKKYLKDLKKYADLKMDKNGCITSYKLKNGRPEKRKNAERPRGRPKKARGNGSGQPAGNQEEEELIVDEVVAGTGFPMPERIIITPKVEIIDHDEPVEDTLDPEYVVPAYVHQPKTEVVEPIYYPAYNTDGEVVVQDQCASVGMVTETMQRIETSMTEMKNDLEASLDAKMMGIMNFFKKEFKNNRNESAHGTSEVQTASNKKRYLLNLLKLITSLGSPGTAAIEQEIGMALENIPDDDETLIPEEIVNDVIESAKRAIDLML